MKPAVPFLGCLSALSSPRLLLACEGCTDAATETGMQLELERLLAVCSARVAKTTCVPVLTPVFGERAGSAVALTESLLVIPGCLAPLGMVRCKA